MNRLGGHSVRKLMNQYNEKNDDQADLVIEANELDRHYIPSRYPGALPSGSPKDIYVEVAANRCLESAKRIIAFVRQKRELITGGDENE